MSVYLGELGRLVELKCPSGQAVAVDDGFSFEMTLEGRVKAQARAVRRRAWQVDIGAATPAELASLLAFAGGEWGFGPFVWVSADAPVTNMLSPEVSLCGPEAATSSGATVGGPMQLGGEWAGRSLTTTGTVTVGGAPVPVLPGQPVTASAWVLGAGATVRLHWYGATGAQISMVTSSGRGTAAAASRLHATGTPPAGAVSCALSVAGASQMARPAITWTDRPFDWQPGEGCPKAVLHGLSKQVLLALRTPGYGRYADASFTVTEVG